MNLQSTDKYVFNLDECLMAKLFAIYPRQFYSLSNEKSPFFSDMDLYLEPGLALTAAWIGVDGSMDWR
jgi:hypothetical protein